MGAIFITWQIRMGHVKKNSLEDYSKLANEFTGEKFNADEIIKMAVDVQMKSATFDVQHHDGFAFWDTKATKYKSMKDPTQRDFLK